MRTEAAPGQPQPQPDPAEGIHPVARRQVSNERRMEEGNSEPAVEAGTRHRTNVQRLVNVVTDPEVLAYLCYTAGLGTDAYGRAMVSRKALMAGAGLISGVDAVQALQPIVKKIMASPGQAPDQRDGVLHSVLNSARFGLQIGVPGQTISAIRQESSEPGFVELDRAEAQKAAGYGFGAAASSFGAFVMSVVKRMPETSQGGVQGAFRNVPTAVLDALKDPADRGKLVDSVALSIEAAGRLKLNPWAITIGNGVQLGHYGVSAAQAVSKKDGSVAKRSFVAAANMAMFAAFIGTTAKTWFSVEQGAAGSPTVRAKREDLYKAYVCSAVAAAAAASVWLVTAADAWRANPGSLRAEAAQRRSTAPAQPEIGLPQLPAPATTATNPSAAAARLGTSRESSPAAAPAEAREAAPARSPRRSAESNLTAAGR
ncbi:hypothetical protein [Phytohabitans suffuscus]|uniref:hypothetical protein n=1 Tax=Phytohabitans suffuscus TaxID=624315 RepID=UPI001566C621|nr:hypothetical protein [Phytohabitans suffuscus]